VIHTCNPNYIGVRVKRIAVQGQPEAKAKRYLKNKLKQKELGAVLSWQAFVLISSKGPKFKPQYYQKQTKNV
jgi:hypothetical protein